MVIDQERWHDGVGYDLDALAALDEDDQVVIEAELIARATTDWRDVQALAALGTPAAILALQKALVCGDHEIEMAVLRHAPSLVDASGRIRAIVRAIGRAELCDGLGKALDQAGEFHPPPVHRALQRALLRREGDAAMLIAGLLFYIHGKAEEPFDWAQRPFFLRFHTEDPAERKAAYRELCAILGLSPLRGD